MVCCKLDKIDKIFIAFTFIIVTFVCLFNTFCFASQNVEVVPLDGYRVDTNQGVSTFQSSSNGVGFYFEPIKGHTYKITNTYTGSPSTSSISIMRLPVIPYEGYQTTNQRNYLNPGLTYEYTANDDDVLCVFVGKNTYVGDFLEKITVVDVTPVGFQAVIGNLTLNVGLTQLWNIIQNSIPYVLVVVTVSLGFYFILHAIKEVSKGRDV